MATNTAFPRLWTAPPRRLSCAVLTDAQRILNDWTDLQNRCERNELTQSPEWNRTWWRVFGSLQGRQLRLAAFKDGERLVGLAPFLRRRHWYRGILPFRRLELLASGEPAEHGIYSNHVGVLAETGCEARVAKRLVDAIKAGDFGRWDEVVLPMMSGDTMMPQRLAEAFRSAGFDAELKETNGAPYVSLPATWDDYLLSLPGKQRKNLKRMLRLFDEWSGGTTPLECISSPADLERGKKILIDLHHARWQSDAQTGVFHSPLFMQFHDLMMRDLAERGQLELLILRAHGKPVAAIYSMVHAGKVSTYQLGRDPEVPDKLSVGVVAFAYAIRHAIEQGRREFDMLADAVFYKTQLTSQVRPLVRLRVVRRCWVEAIRRAGERLKPKQPEAL